MQRYEPSEPLPTLDVDIVQANVRFIVVFDFGGGTLDVSLLSVEGGWSS